MGPVLAPHPSAQQWTGAPGLQPEDTGLSPRHQPRPRPRPRASAQAPGPASPVSGLTKGQPPCELFESRGPTRGWPDTSLRTQPLEQTSISHLSKWPSSQRPQMTCAGKNVEKRESSNTWQEWELAQSLRRTVRRLSRTKSRTTTGHSSSTADSIPK